MNKIYPLEKSPLYKIRNRKKLAILLGLPEEYFCISHELTIFTIRRTRKLYENS